MIPKWVDLSKEDRKKAVVERKRIGISLGKGGKGEKGGNPCENNNNNNKSFRKFKRQNRKFKNRLSH